MDEQCAIEELYDQELIIRHNFNINYVMKRPHFHDGFEINLAITDGMQFFIEDKAYQLRSGTVTLINNNESHYNIAPRGQMYERYIISFLPEYLNGFPSEQEDLYEYFIRRPRDFVHCVQCTPEQLADFTALADRLIDYSDRRGAYACELRKKLLLAEILLLCNEIFSNNRKDYPDCFDTRIRPITAFIRDHLSEELSLDRLCSEFFLSKSHFIALFRETMGITPNQYVITQRIMKSREFLRAGVSVMKTCELIGFGDESHFIRTFKQIVGMTPKQYGIKYANHLIASLP